MSEVEMTELSKLTLNDFYQKLNERVSDYNAKLLMQSVMIGAGISGSDYASTLKVNEARNVCLELIKKGGPAFQVGKAMYQQVQ